MNLQGILEKFSVISSVSLDDSSKCIDICEESMNEINHSLKSEVDVQENSNRLEVVAAALAFYKYTLYRASSISMESFSAGELKIKSDPNTSVKMAYRVWQEARASVSDLLKDENFVFERIVL